MHTAHRNNTRKPISQAVGGNLYSGKKTTMSADLYQKKKKGYTTVLLRLSTGTQAKARGSDRARTTSRVRFIPKRATPARLTASLQAIQTACGY